MQSDCSWAHTFFLGRGDENLLKLIGVMGPNSVNTLKTMNWTLERGELYGM